jgi:hypothetical protein
MKSKTFKKLTAMLLAVMLVFSMCATAVSVSAAETAATYIVAGAQELCGLGATGYGWDSTDTTNAMTANEDGTYSKVFTDVAVKNDYQFKITSTDAEGTVTWYGIDGGADNFTFHVIEVCDVTITFDPTTLKLSATGTGVKIPTGIEIEALRTVGNGDETWLNGANWDPADDANIMTEVAPNVYEITYTGVEEFDNYQVKFAANGSWAVNWGGVYEGSGITSPAVFNGNDNIIVEVPYEVADVTIRLDLTAFDYATKEGATFTITVVDPTTVVPTEPTEPEVEIVDYVIAGVPALCGLGATGYGWDPTDVANTMTANADGTYTMTYADVAVANDYQFKVVGLDAEGTAYWYGIDGGADNFTFHVNAVCDVVITFDPATKKITAEGAGVVIPTGIEIEAIRTVGNGDETWLNGVNWDPADDANMMTEVAPNVYEITYTGVEEFDNYQVKFAANGSWAVNWGGVYEGSGITSPAVFNGNDNIIVEVPYAVADVTIRLDLTAFDYATKEGATFTITVEDTAPEVSVSVFGDINLELAETEEAGIFEGAIELQAGTYKFNVDNNGTVHGTNYTYTDTAVIDYSAGYKAQTTLKVSGGRYTFTFNANTKKLTIKFKSFEDIVEFVGDINAELVRPNKNTTVFTGTIRLEAGSYKFNVNEHGELFGVGYTFNDSIYNIPFSYKSAATFNATGGIYSVRYDTANNQVKILKAPEGLGDVSIFGDISLPLAAQGNGVFSAQTILDAGSYDIRVDSFGTFFGNGTTFTDTVNVEFKTEWKAAATLKVTEKMKFTFIFDTNTNKVKVFNAPIDTTKVKVAFDDIDALVLTSADGVYFTGTITLEAGDYTFRMDEFGTPMGGKYTFTDSKSGMVYNASYASATTMTATGGTYTFTYNVNTDALTVKKA